GVRPWPARPSNASHCRALHVDPAARADVLREALRVERKLAVIGFPCGPDAFSVDRRLYEAYRTRGWSPPRWLEEHMRNGLPDERVVEGLPGEIGRASCREGGEIEE